MSFIVKNIMKKNVFILLLMLVLFAWDQLSKWFFYDLKWGQKLPFLYPTLNTWISRGVQVYLPIVILVSLLGIWLFVFLWRKKYLNDRVFILFLAGTLGNLVDRIFLDGVRDFISIGIFPVFNLADCFLSLAVMILIRNEIFPCIYKKKH